jgi:hypothetical protein
MSATTVYGTTTAPLRQESSAVSATDWLTRLFDQLENWSAAARMREVEAYLSQAKDAADLEHRMTQLQNARRSQALLLR